jgi:hypothetical protein
MKVTIERAGATAKKKVRQKNSWVESGSGNLPSE